MPDLWQAAADAIFAQLNEAIPATQAAVRQDVRQDTQPPFVLVGDMDGKGEGGKGEVLDRLTIDVQVVTRGSRTDLLALMWAVREALENAQLTADGVRMSSLAWSNGSTATGQDGVTRAGLHQFEVLIEAA